MTVPPFIPDVATPPAARETQTVQPSPRGFGAVLNGLGAALGEANTAEESFASGNGDLQSAVYERARADVALAVAVAAAQRTAQALQSIFNLQV